MRPVYAGGPNFGLLEFTPGAIPKLSFSLFNEAGDSAWKPLTLTPADLKNGVSTWKAEDRREGAREAQCAPRELNLLQLQAAAIFAQGTNLKFCVSDGVMLRPSCAMKMPCA